MSSMRQNMKLSSTSPSSSGAEPLSSHRPAKRLKTRVRSETNTETEAHDSHVVSNDPIKDTRMKTEAETQTKTESRIQPRRIATEFDDKNDKRTLKT